MGDPTLEDVADVLLEMDPPVTTAGEVADELDCSRRHALDLLRLLEHAGDVESKSVGARAVAWWHIERVLPPRTPGGASRDTGSTPPHSGDIGEDEDSTTGVDRDDDPGGDREEPGDEDRDAEDVVETADDDGAIGRGGAASHNTDPESEQGDREQDGPGVTDAEIERAVERAAEHWDDTPDRLAARKEAAVAALRLIHDEGPIPRGEVVDRLHAEYQVPGQSDDTWWRKNIAETPDAPLDQLGRYTNGVGWELVDE